MSEIKFAGIVPLIGGMDLGAAQAFGSKPECLMSWKPFWNNDQHIVHHYENEVPYYVLDEGQEGEFKKHSKIDVVHATCPCAGLSMLSHGYGDDNPANKWMPTAAEYVLGTVRPKVFYGENAPALAGKVGKNVRANLIEIGRKHGYRFSIYRTRSLLHGVPQVRERSFYFFWEGSEIPILNYYNEPRVRIEDVIRSVTSNFQTEVISKKVPSEADPYYRFILEGMHGGVTHREFSTKILQAEDGRGNDSLSYIEKKGYTWPQVGEWMEANGYPKEAKKCLVRQAKLDSGGSIMRRGTIVPKDYIGAFVGHYPTFLTHPDEDRYINYREAMTIMGLPQNFELIDPVKNANHI